MPTPLRLSGTPFPGPWRERAACRRVPTEAFFEPDDAAAAKAVCRGCPVRPDCLDYALGLPGLVGVWGGTDEAERRRERRARADRRHQPAPAVTAPARRAAAGTLAAALAELARHPGRWARVAGFPSPHSATATASLLRAGKRAVPPGSWRFEARRNEAGGSDLYAVCVTPAAEPRRGRETSA